MLCLHHRLTGLAAANNNDLHVLLQKTSAGDKSLYAVTDDEATVAILLKRMREMDPAGNGIVRSEFKRFVLRTMHTGNVRQNHRLWRRLQTKMVKSGALDLSVTEVALVSELLSRLNHHVPLRLCRHLLNPPASM